MDDTRRDATDTPLNPPDPDAEPFARRLAGMEIDDEKDAVLDEDEVEVASTELTGEVRDEGYLDAAMSPSGDTRDAPDSVEQLTDRDLRSGETDDADMAAEEGLTYVPSTDPPVIPSDDPQGAEIAAGTGSTSMEEPYDADHHTSELPSDDEMTARVREALRADASTSDYADRIGIETRGRIVVLRGLVEDLDDSDNLVATASSVSGVVEVVDALDVRGV